MLHTFSTPRLRSIHFGQRCLVEAIASLAGPAGWKRVLVVTSPSLLKTRAFSDLERSLAGFERQIFSMVRQHTPLQCVEELERAVAAFSPNVAISFGGGSAGDATRAALLAAGSTIERMAVPTTLSGAEFSPYFAQTDEKGEKHVRLDPNASAARVIVDPCLVLETPSRLWFSTGMKSYADCIEAFLSPGASSLTDRLALDALADLDAGLQATCNDPDDLEVRLKCQLAPFFSIAALINAGSGLIAALRHQLGARYGIPHGLASIGVMLSVLELLSSSAPERVKILEAHLGVTRLGLQQHCAALLERFGLSHDLREYLHGESLLPMTDQLMRDPFIGQQDRDTVRSVLERIMAPS